MARKVKKPVEIIEPATVPIRDGDGTVEVIPVAVEEKPAKPQFKGVQRGPGESDRDYAQRQNDEWKGLR